jgi:hypothetical protein
MANFLLPVRKTAPGVDFMGILKQLLLIIFNSYKFLTKERPWDMFHTRYGKKGGEGCYGRNIRGFLLRH